MWIFKYILSFVYPLIPPAFLPYLTTINVTRKYDPDSVSISIGLQLQHERFTPLKGHLLLIDYYIDSFFL